MEEHSIVEVFQDAGGHSCGYCKGPDTSVSQGMWAHTLTVGTYQALIDRGWRRSGKYCYKPIMDVTCCPLYTIRCFTKDFKVSKSQRKILKRVHKFLATGVEKKDLHKAEIKHTSLSHSMEYEQLEALASKSQLNLEKTKFTSVDLSLCFNSEASSQGQSVDVNTKTLSIEVSTVVPKDHSNKAKYLRIQRKREKLKARGLTEEEITKTMLQKKKIPVKKTLEDFINEKMPDNPSHKLTITLVRTESKEFEQTSMESYNLFAKYQKFIHKETDDDCDWNNFKSFLIDSPLKATQKHGSFHQQCWLDSKLIGVGVIDILPKCVSSVYFFYDPDYAFLTLGTYAALREIAFTRKLTIKHADIQHYYMGFYIHSCIKMRYKAAFTPSFLLCPEVYTWHPAEECKLKLESNKYCRFNEDETAKDVDEGSINDVLVLYKKTAMPFKIYLKKKNAGSTEIETLKLFAKFFGKTICRQVLIYRS